MPFELNQNQSYLGQYSDYNIVFGTSLTESNILNRGKSKISLLKILPIRPLNINVKRATQKPTFIEIRPFKVIFRCKITEQQTNAMMIGKMMNMILGLTPDKNILMCQ